MLELMGSKKDCRRILEVVMLLQYTNLMIFRFNHPVFTRLVKGIYFGHKYY
jgi:hypothetical protein